MEQAESLAMHEHVRDTVYALLMSLELHDAVVCRHSLAMPWLTDRFAQYLDLPHANLVRLRRTDLRVSRRWVLR